ncbi:NAD(P)-binding protein [Armillaria gallica]|uniref:Short-chain dehydrogenase/reductase ARMGADRAFT_1048226 n=1 Tax=Armillaria gallica TaxID=47427 RepID=ARMD3_ARMGA|nr:RecName: Full=Short-chain dehydrogenase/reductase ARMGADRAFT_1048226; AltName: Full=Melleolides biosynthesis cluster protein ARMGADRAFT_1048226 [Armillaria gallica]PBK84749.1 NAD(P)-binding protein [Armillaria gallica]
MGNVWSLTSQMFPPKPKWTVDDMPDLTGKVVIVTGGNTGCGKESVRVLLLHGAKVYLAARSEGKAKEAIEDLKKETGHEAIFLPLDLADLVSVRRGAEEFLSKEKQLHILFNNAGVMLSPMEMLTKQGYDLQFGTNVIGHFHFTKLVLPALLAAATPTEKARVITTSSSANYMGTLNFDLWADGPARNKKAPGDMYVQSKHGNVVFAVELARRYGAQNIISHSLNPGSIRTDLQRHLSPFANKMQDIFLFPVSMGALTQLWAGTSPEAGQMNGEFMIPWARLGKARKETGDPEVGKKLWEWLEAQCKDY